MDVLASGRLVSVVYRLFPEVMEVGGYESGDGQSHDVGTEICLSLAGAGLRYISWTVQDDEDILALSCVKYFSDALVDIDVSRSPMWCDLVGKFVEIVYLDGLRLVVIVRSSEGDVVMVSAYDSGRWGHQCLRVSKDIPPGYPEG